MHPCVRLCLCISVKPNVFMHVIGHVCIVCVSR